MIILLLVVLLLGVGRLAAYRFQSERRIDRQKETQEKLAIHSGMAWLMLNLKDPQWTGSATKWITLTNSMILTNDTTFAVCGDGHRFEVRVKRSTNEVLRADLTVPDTGHYTNVIVNGLVKLE